MRSGMGMMGSSRWGEGCVSSRWLWSATWCMAPSKRVAWIGWVWRSKTQASAASWPARSGCPAWASWIQARASTRVSPSTTSDAAASAGTGDLDPPAERSGLEVGPREQVRPERFRLVAQRLGVVVVEDHEPAAGLEPVEPGEDDLVAAAVRQGADVKLVRLARAAEDLVHPGQGGAEVDTGRVQPGEEQLVLLGQVDAEERSRGPRSHGDREGVVNVSEVRDQDLERPVLGHHGVDQEPRALEEGSGGVERGLLG